MIPKYFYFFSICNNTLAQYDITCITYPQVSLNFSTTVKSFVGTKFHGLTRLNMFMDTRICGF